MGLLLSYLACMVIKLAEFRLDITPLSGAGGIVALFAYTMAFNYQRVVDYARKCPENLRWVEENDLLGLVMGLNLSALEGGRGEVRSNMISATKAVPGGSGTILSAASPSMPPKTSLSTSKSPP